MGFLRRIFSKDNTVEKKDTVPELNKIVSDSRTEDTSQNIKENNIFNPTPVNLMNKLFHNQKTALSEGPETLYENEAWAPVSEYNMLFRKHRVNIEEQSTTSDS